MSQYHITVQEGSRLPPVRRCSQCCMSYHCPLCGPHVYKPAHRYKVHRHLKCHLSRAVRFKGYSIYKCNLGCRPQAHFHCFCEKLFLNRNQFIHHLNTKHEFLPATDHGGGGDDDDDGAEETLPLSPSSGQQPNADPSPTCAPVGDTPSSCEANSVTTWTSGAFSSIAAPPVSEGPALNNELASAPSESINATTESPPVVGGSEYHLNPTPVELEILTQLRVLQQQQSQILQLLLKLTNTGGVNDSTAADLGAVFPVTDEEGLATLALKLIETPDLKNRLISFLGDNDGLPIDQTVQRILERMLSNTFAKRMDWRGKNNKVSFASSCLKEIVNDAVRRNSVCARAADEAVESVVKKWLQQAGERDEGAEGRREEREVHH